MTDFTTPAVERIAGGFQFTEGPAWIADRQELLFSDIPASRIYRYKDGKADVWREPSYQANGNTLDPQGRLLTCEHETRRITRTEPDGSLTVLADRYDGKRLNSPNDIVCQKNGAIYFTDPPYGVKPELRELDFQGVFRISPTEPPTLTVVAHDFVKPNGLVFSMDEQRLYIADTELNHIRVFDVLADGTLRGGRLFCDVERPDGLEMDTTGHLYVASMTSVVVFDGAGAIHGEIPLPERPSNIEFGDADGQTLYITARTSLYRCRLPWAGAKLR